MKAAFRHPATVWTPNAAVGTVADRIAVTIAAVVGDAASTLKPY